MATYQSPEISRRKPTAGFGAGGGQVRAEIGTIAVPAGATTTDVLQFFNLPANARVVGGWVKSDALGGTVTVNIGDAGNGINAAVAARYFAAASLVAAGVSTGLAFAGYNFATGGQKMLVTGVLTSAAASAGNVTLCLQYTCEEPQGAA